MDEQRGALAMRISEACLQLYPWMRFAYCGVRGLLSNDPSERLAARRCEAELRVRQEAPVLLERACALSRFYRVQREPNRSHIESLIKAIAGGKSIKPVNAIVDAVMIAEMEHALLLGVHDLDRISGEAILDVAGEGELFDGIGGLPVVTRPGEVVLRDAFGIWASYVQGPDARTIVTNTTENVILLGFFAPETDPQAMREGMGAAIEIIVNTRNGAPEPIRIIPA